MSSKGYSQGQKPSGIIGYTIGYLMNLMQTKGHVSVFEQYIPGTVSNLLDIGCGGGAVLKRLIKKEKVIHGFGLDHSMEMIQLASQNNRKLIKKKSIEFIQGSVDCLDYPTNYFDVVSALETIQFWPNISQSIKQINLVLQENGRFLIVNRYPKVGSPWYDKMQLKSTKDYCDILEKNGFVVNLVDVEWRPGWIIIEAEKKPHNE